MSVTVIDYGDAFIGVTERKTNLALRYIAEAVHQSSLPTTPKKTGRLRADVLKQVLGLRARIIWAKDYAEKMESLQFKHYTTAGTGPHFAQNAVKREAIDNLAAHMRKAGIV